MFQTPGCRSTACSRPPVAGVLLQWGFWSMQYSCNPTDSHCATIHSRSSSPLWAVGLLRAEPGHFATGPTHIDDFVQSVRVVTPSGHVLETRRLPSSGAGPSEHRQYVGSEGIYGVSKCTGIKPLALLPVNLALMRPSVWTPIPAVTEVSLRVLRRPERRAQATVLFQAEDGDTDAAFLTGARCVRKLVQSGLRPEVPSRSALGQSGASIPAVGQ